MGGGNGREKSKHRKVTPEGESLGTKKDNMFVFGAFILFNFSGFAVWTTTCLLFDLSRPRPGLVYFSTSRLFEFSHLSNVFNFLTF